MSGVAERIYYDSAELVFAAEVTDIRLHSTEQDESGAKVQLWQVALDRTAFYPEGGGQPWDVGTLTATAPSGAQLVVPVERVEEDAAGPDGAEVWHFVRKPLMAGTVIEGRVDAARRMDHAQQHTGQHLLSAVFLRELGARTVSFHLGAESSTIDLALAEGQSGLSAEDLARVEDAVAREIYADRAMRPRWVSSEEARAMLERGELRKLPEREGPMRIVTMEGIEHNACGGTHVGSTGAIGGLLIRKVEKNKQGWRVEFLCGLRAVHAAREDYARLDALARSLSIANADVPARVVALLEETKAAAKREKSLLDELATAEATRLVSRAAAGEVVTAIYAEKTVDFAKMVASKVAAGGFAAVIGATQGANGAIAAARVAESAVHAGNVLREAMQAAGARGGGSAELAQGVCGAEMVAGLVGTVAAAMGR